MGNKYTRRARAESADVSNKYTQSGRLRADYVAEKQTGALFDSQVISLGVRRVPLRYSTILSEGLVDSLKIHDSLAAPARNQCIEHKGFVSFGYPQNIPRPFIEFRRIIEQAGKGISTNIFNRKGMEYL